MNFHCWELSEADGSADLGQEPFRFEFRIRIGELRFYVAETLFSYLRNPFASWINQTLCVHTRSVVLQYRKFEKQISLSSPSLRMQAANARWFERASGVELKSRWPITEKKLFSHTPFGMTIELTVAEKSETHWQTARVLFGLSTQTVWKLIDGLFIASCLGFCVSRSWSSSGSSLCRAFSQLQPAHINSENLLLSPRLFYWKKISNNRRSSIIVLAPFVDLRSSHRPCRLPVSIEPHEREETASVQNFFLKNCNNEPVQRKNFFRFVD